MNCKSNTVQHFLNYKINNKPMGHNEILSKPHYCYDL